MKIAVLGTGNIGGGLARAWAKKGHELHLGARNPSSDDVKELVAETGARAESLADAVAAAEVVALAVPFGAVDSVLAQIGPHLDGKVLIDCTNPVGPGLTMVYGEKTSGSEEIAKKVPRARVVKSFNAQGAENLSGPIYGEIRATNFYCGDDAEAKRIVAQLVDDVGFEPLDAGSLKSARYLEAMTLLWITISRTTGRDIAFKLLRR